MTEAPEFPSQDERRSEKSDVKPATEVLATLSEREIAILTLRFGLQDDTQKTLEEIGEHFGLTREGIGQIQDQALKTLRPEWKRGTPRR